ncbi:MAG: hypothetical protein JJU29_04170 [Verrucomicrobia bacterium]|nr:hypothetical protein [Verrucomicrobiota bacterium]MCH8511740.1 hypothetical protein [Kiritimatiellia bacterium]
MNYPHFYPCLFFRTFLWLLIGFGFSFHGNAEIQRPFLLWTQSDIDRMRADVEAGGEYAERVERTLANPESQETHLLALWRWAVLEDESARDAQKARLLQVTRSAVPRGAAQWLTVLRYDLLYDELSDEEREEVEDFFRTYIDHAVFRNSIFDGEVFNDERNYSRYHAHYHRINNWLPNITFPRVLSANLMAAALGEEDLIRRVWDHYGSWRWYFDDYLTDWGFYGEEVGKQHALVGEKLLYALALDNLGLGELGFDYQGRRGATLRGHVATNLDLAYPFVDLHTDQPHLPRMTSGDLRGPARDKQNLRAFQDAVIPGYLPNGEGTLARWTAAGAWGGEIRGHHPQWDGYSGFTPKWNIPLWFEVAHRRWPDAGFDYFLAQMRAPGQEAYQPTLYFGIDPIHPDDTRPPRAPSRIAEARGLVMLRADESPDHWMSAAPALGVRLATPYAHDVFDNFAITGFYAFNRPIYLNRQIGGYAQSWTRSILSHGGVKVDGHEPGFTRMTTVRSNLQSELKFMAMHSPELYPDIDATRFLFLTDDYLLDLYHLRDRQENDRTFRWTVHPLGLAELEEGTWSEPRRLTGEWGATNAEAENATRHRLLPGPQEILDVFGDMRVRETDEGWHLRVVQRSPVPEENRMLAPEWFAREIGVDLRMLGEAETGVAVGDTPLTFDPEETPSMEEHPQHHEVGGTSVLVQRRVPAAVFAALHEPFEGGGGRISGFRRVVEDEQHLVVGIGGPDQPVRDLALVQYIDDGSKIVVNDPETQTEVQFRDHALVRVDEESVQVFGDVQHIRLPAPAGDETRYYHNGRLTRAQIADGFLEYETRER